MFVSSLSYAVEGGHGIVLKGTVSSVVVFHSTLRVGRHSMGVLWRRGVLAYGLGALMVADGLSGPLESLTRERWVPLDSTATDQTTDVATSSSGSMVYISGYKQGAPGADGTQSTVALLMAYNSSGAQKWAVEYGSGVETLGNSVAADGTGVYLAGTVSVPSNNTGPDEQDDKDAFVVKYNSTGGLVWKTSWGTSEPDGGNGVAVDDGSKLVYVVGSTQGSMDEESRASGTLEAAEAAATGAGGEDGGGSEEQGGSEGGGESESAGLEGKVVAANAGLSDVFLTCLDAVNGGVLWTRQFGSSSKDVGNSVAVGPRGGVFLVGQLGDDEDLSRAGPLAFLAKYDYLGNAQFAARLNSSSNHYAVDLAPSVGSGGEGVVYMSGYTMGDSPEVFLARFEGSTGAQTWLSHLGEEGGMPHEAQSVAVVEGDQRGFGSGGGAGGGGGGGGGGGDSSAAASSVSGGGAPVVEGGGAAAYSEPGNGARVVVVGHNTSAASAESHSSTGFTAAADTNGEWTWYSVSQRAERETAIAISAGGGFGGVGKPEDSFAFIVGTVAADEASPGNVLFLDIQKVVREALPTPAPALSSGLTPGPSAAIDQMGGASATTGLSQGSSLWLLIIAPIFVVVSCILIVGYVSKQCTIAFGTRPPNPDEPMGSMEFTPRGVGSSGGGGGWDHGSGNKRPSSRSKRSLRRARPSPPSAADWRDNGSPHTGSPGRRRREGKDGRGWPRSVAAAFRSKGDGGPGPPYRKLETKGSDGGGEGRETGETEPLPSRGRQNGEALDGDDPELAMTAHRGGASVVSARGMGPSEEGSWVGGGGGGRSGDRKSLALDSPDATFEWDAFESEAPAGPGDRLGAHVSGNPRDDEPAGMFVSESFVGSPKSPRIFV